MAGKKGMVHRKKKANTARDRIWRSIRIMRRFTLPDLCRTAGAKMDNCKKFVRLLETHGIVARFGPPGSGQPGRWQAYRLVRETPARPLICSVCGGPLTRPCGGNNDD